MKQQLMLEAEQMAGQLSAWRRELHQIPELALKLPQTVAYVTGKLDEMGVRYEVHEESSNIVAYIGQGDKCFLIRGDMDALPVEEKSGEPFASTNGCMHACGHDLHTTSMLGAARLLKNHESELHGVVKLLFQSAEETFEGAKAAIEEGVMENPHVDAALAQHVFAQIPVGTIQYHTNPMAAVYGFRIKLTGKGSHGSMPEQSIDPINTGVHIHLALQELISREVSASQEAVLTIGKFWAGSAANVIPETLVMEGTLRAFKEDIREMLIKRIHEVVNSVAQTYRTKAEIEVLSDVPPVVCNEELLNQMLEVVHNLDDEIVTLPTFHAMGSEDFACITSLVPGAHFCVGAGVEDPAQRYAQHNPAIRFNEKAIPLCAAIYAAGAMEYLK